MRLARDSQPSIPLPVQCEMERTASVGTPNIGPLAVLFVLDPEVLSDKPLGATRARNDVVPPATVYARLAAGAAFEDVTVVVLSLVFPSQPPRPWIYKEGGTA
jgi:hypothetical protein